MVKRCWSGKEKVIKSFAGMDCFVHKEFGHGLIPLPSFNEKHKDTIE